MYANWNVLDNNSVKELGCNLELTIDTDSIFSIRSTASGIPHSITVDAKYTYHATKMTQSNINCLFIFTRLYLLYINVTNSDNNILTVVSMCVIIRKENIKMDINFLIMSSLRVIANKNINKYIKNAND